MTPLPPRPPGEEVVAVMSLAARAAGDAILRIYRQIDHGVVIKDDDSPLTRADLAAHGAIADTLAGALGGLPMLSEEGDQPPWAQRRHWRRYWLIDPLDGTREFIRRNGQFTVNIALVEDGVAVLGVILVPVSGTLYTGLRDSPVPGQWRCWKSVAGGSPVAIRVRSLSSITVREPFTLVASRQHAAARTARLAELLGAEFGQLNRSAMGSSLKMCLVAEGRADLYPRYGPTGEWDTAAAQAIVEAAGGCLCGLDGLPLRYNGRERPVNPSFYAAGDATRDWSSLLRAVAAEE